MTSGRKIGVDCTTRLIVDAHHHYVDAVESRERLLWGKFNADKIYGFDDEIGK